MRLSTAGTSVTDSSTVCIFQLMQFHQFLMKPVLHHLVSVVHIPHSNWAPSHHCVIAGEITSLDPMPPFPIPEYIDILTTYVTSLINASLSQGRLSDRRKRVIITPLLSTRHCWHG